MSPRSLVASCVFVLGLAATSRSDCLVRDLPNDGAWAVFWDTEQFDDGTKRDLWITIKSVGRTEMAGEPCRWIEIKYQSEESRKKETGTVFKLLIPEMHLKPGGDPLKHVLKAWRKNPTLQEPVPIDRIEDWLPRLYLVVAPPIENLKKTDEQQNVDWQQGQLACSVLEGSNQYTTQTEKISARYRLAVNPKVPFGVAAAKVEIESNDGYKGTLQYSLIDMGTGAVSDLPQ